MVLSRLDSMVRFTHPTLSRVAFSVRHGTVGEGRRAMGPSDAEQICGCLQERLRGVLDRSLNVLLWRDGRRTESLSLAGGTWSEVGDVWLFDTECAAVCGDFGALCDARGCN